MRQEDTKLNKWVDGIFGVIVGDALGCPVQFMSREDIKARGAVEGMIGYGTYNMPPGTWTDDGSMTLALLASIKEVYKIDLDDIMRRFIEWDSHGAYTQYNFAFDQGSTCMAAIERYKAQGNPHTCGCTGEFSNGNGSLMRIMPACLYACSDGLIADEAIKVIHEVGGLTHNHKRSLIGCGLYYFCVRAILYGTENLNEDLQRGMTEGFGFYKGEAELRCYERLKDVNEFAKTPESEIRSSGYIVDSLEAAIWSLVTTHTFKDCLLKAVNLGGDTDTIAAIAGGLAGLYYGYDSIPDEWLNKITDREWVKDLCER